MAISPSSPLDELEEMAERIRLLEWLYYPVGRWYLIKETNDYQGTGADS
jgi:hypothetical protein